MYWEVQGNHIAAEGRCDNTEVQRPDDRPQQPTCCLRCSRQQSPEIEERLRRQNMASNRQNNRPAFRARSHQVRIRRDPMRLSRVILATKPASGARTPEKEAD